MNPPRPRFTEEFLVAVLDALDEGVIAFDSLGRLIAANPSAVRMLDMDLAAMRGRPVTDLTHTPLRADGTAMPAHEHPVARTLRSGVEVTGMVMGLRPPIGDPRWLSANTRLMPATEESPQRGLVLSFTDVTDRLNAEAALRWRAEFDDLVTRLSGQFLSTRPEQTATEIDRALAEIGEFARVDRCYLFLVDEDNEAVTNVHEWTAPGISSRKDGRQRMPRETLPWLMRKLERHEAIHIPDVTDLPSEAVAERAELARHAVRSMAVVPMVRRGRLIGFVGFDAVRDAKLWSPDAIALLRLVAEILTNALERRVAQRALSRAADQLRRHAAELARANDQLRHADTVKTDFLSMTSHELRTPLASILGYSEMLVGDWSTLDERTRRTAIEAIDRHGRRLYRLVDDLLIESRIASRTLQPSSQTASVAQVVHEALDQVPTPADVHVEIPAHITVRVDREHACRMVAQLVSNAVTYGAPPITVDARWVDGIVELRVGDEGAGVPDEFIPQLFEPFAQASTGIQREASGVGLGLAIVRGLAELNSGTARYEPPGSRPQVAGRQPSGGCFVVVLPGG
ncbi:MAG: ATP-binding protein [Actinomycetota bacterium]|nr:ATP-binding protein [Actinomycetota bacterium]